jgi:alkanesulfonate monooxygenase SsuD/methylene tetrahydromethanopterin reductase-like flavin-dependent oxidoreductase (luciferase family)
MRHGIVLFTSDPITLAKTIATLDHLSRGRVSLGAGFGAGAMA